MSHEKPTFAEVKEQFHEVAPRTGHSMTTIEKMAKQAARGTPPPREVSKAFGGFENLATAGQVIIENCNFKNRNCTPG